jgi:hypothetical protein
LVQPTPSPKKEKTRRRPVWRPTDIQKAAPKEQAAPKSNGNGSAAASLSGPYTDHSEEREAEEREAEEREAEEREAAPTMRFRSDSRQCLIVFAPKIAARDKSVPRQRLVLWRAGRKQRFDALTFEGASPEAMRDAVAARLADALGEPIEDLPLPEPALDLVDADWQDHEQAARRAGQPAPEEPPGLQVFTLDLPPEVAAKLPFAQPGEGPCQLPMRTDMLDAAAPYLAPLLTLLTGELHAGTQRLALRPTVHD